MAGMIKFNVGGISYTTTMDTIKQDPGGLLVRMMEGGVPTIKYHKGIFIDRDGKLFRHILDYLRNVTTWSPPKNVETDALIREADFFLLFGMKKILEMKSREKSANEVDIGGTDKEGTDKEELVNLRKQYPILIMNSSYTGEYSVSVSNDDVMKKYGNFRRVHHATSQQSNNALYNNMTEAFKIGYRLKAIVPEDVSNNFITYVYESKD